MRSSSDLPTHDDLRGRLRREMRVFSAQTVLYTQAVADRLGVNLTDLHCAAILREAGPITAGRLAELTGLTTGAITGIVDRLVRAGYARRAPDPHDRRRVIVRLLPDKLEQEVAPLFAPMLQATADLSADFNEEALSRIIDFIASSTRVLRDETARLRTERGEGTQRARGRRPTPPGKAAPRGPRRPPPRFR
jgi:DNA-binding MarR family transcriptional regulator